MACKSHAGGGDDDAEKRACAQPERAAIEVEVEATGGVNVQLGDRISRGQALGLGGQRSLGSPDLRRLAFEELLSAMPEFSVTAVPERIRSVWAWGFERLDLEFAPVAR